MHIKSRSFASRACARSAQDDRPLARVSREEKISRKLEDLCPRDAITREKVIKGWVRSRKTRLIDSRNPTWEDLLFKKQVLRYARLRRAPLRMTSVTEPRHEGVEGEGERGSLCHRNLHDGGFACRSPAGTDRTAAESTLGRCEGQMRLVLVKPRPGRRRMGIPYDQSIG